MATLTQEQIDKVAAILGFEPQDFAPDLWDKQVMEATFAVALTQEQLDKLNMLDRQVNCSDETFQAAYALGYQAGVAAERERAAALCDEMVLYTGYDCAAAIRKEPG